ncbi:MAG TPA: DUF4198 domain-containing protein [Candidatus Acidoferrales bacterium]
MRSPGSGKVLKKTIMLLFIASGPALAHDTWLVPHKFRFAPGETARVALNTSEAFPSSEVAAQPDRILSYELLSASSRRAVTGYRVEGNSLVVDVTLDEAGIHILGVQTRPRLIVMEAKQFHDYLTEESLEAPLRTRKERSQQNDAGRELYSKAAKLAICVGDRTGIRRGGGEQPLGFRLEIIPLSNPCLLAAGDRLRVQVLFEGEPLAGATVHSSYAGRTGHHYALSQSSDARGEAEFLLDRSGAWFVRVLHMVPAPFRMETGPAPEQSGPAASDGEADWESVFATFTFEVR